jgi:hypothetical protein
VKVRGRLRQAKPPAAVLRLLDKDEHVASWADTTNSVVVATNRGLWWPQSAVQEPEAPLESRDQHWRLIGWHTISKVTWDSGALVVIEADVVDDLFLVDRPAVRVEVTIPRDLPASVRKRVEANVVHSELDFVGRGAARLVGRRVPGQDGLCWWARLEDGAVDDGPTRLAVSARLTRLKDEWLAQRESL